MSECMQRCFSTQIHFAGIFHFKHLPLHQHLVQYMYLSNISEPNNVISILISSDFLKMDNLVSEQIIMKYVASVLKKGY